MARAGWSELGLLMQGVMKHLPQQQQQDMLRQWTALFQKSGTNFLQYLSLLQHGKVWRSPTAPLLLRCLPASDNLQGFLCCACSSQRRSRRARARSRARRSTCRGSPRPRLALTWHGSSPRSSRRCHLPRALRSCRSPGLCRWCDLPHISQHQGSPSCASTLERLGYAASPTLHEYVWGSQPCQQLRHISHLLPAMSATAPTAAPSQDLQTRASIAPPACWAQAQQQALAACE